MQNACVTRYTTIHRDLDNLKCARLSRTASIYQFGYFPCNYKGTRINLSYEYTHESIAASWSSSTAAMLFRTWPFILTVATVNRCLQGEHFSFGVARCVEMFNNQTIYATGTNPFSVTTADVNGDNKTDLIVANFGSSNVGVLLNTGNGTFRPQEIGRAHV